MSPLSSLEERKEHDEKLNFSTALLVGNLEQADNSLPQSLKELQTWLAECIPDVLQTCDKETVQSIMEHWPHCRALICEAMQRCLQNKLLHCTLSKNDFDRCFEFIEYFQLQQEIPKRNFIILMVNAILRTRDSVNAAGYTIFREELPKEIIDQLQILALER